LIAAPEDFDETSQDVAGMIAGKQTHVRLVPCLDVEAKFMAKIMNVGGPTRSWAIYRRAAFWAGSDQFEQSPTLSAQHCECVAIWEPFSNYEKPSGHGSPPTQARRGATDQDDIRSFVEEESA
jgi:hypothetical protein